jgi:polyisoprenoid-binding protein YceI
MKGPTRILVLAGVLASIALGVALAATAVPVVLGPKSTLQVFGSSTMHAWELTSVESKVTVHRADGATGNDWIALAKAGQVSGVDVVVPVATLHSEKAGIDKNMLKTMNAKEHPEVTVHLEKFTPAGAAGDTLKLTAEGTLTIAGSTKPVVLNGRMVAGNGGVWLSGDYNLKMSTFGIKPPTMMMGAIKVGDPVTIKYQLLLMNRDAAGNTSATTGQ